MKNYGSFLFCHAAGILYFLGLFCLPLHAADEDCLRAMESVAPHQLLRGEEDVPRFLAEVDESYGLDSMASDYGEGFVSSDGRFALLISFSSSRLWNVTEGKPGPVLEEQIATVSDPAFNADGTRLIGVSAEDQRTLLVFDTKTGKVLSRVGLDREAEVKDISPNGRLAVIAKDVKPATEERSGDLASMLRNLTQRESEVTLRDVSTGQVVRTLRPHRNHLRTAEFSPDGSRVLTSSQDGLVRIEDVATGDVILSYGAGAKVDTASFSPDGKNVIVTTREFKAIVLSPDGKSSASQLPPSIGDIFTAEYAPGRADRVALNTENGVVIWDRVAGKPHLTLNHPDAERSGFLGTAWSSDGKRLLTIDSQGTRFILWDVESGTPLTELRNDTPVDAVRATYTTERDVFAADAAEDALRIWQMERVDVPENVEPGDVLTNDRRYRLVRSTQPDGSIQVDFVPHEPGRNAP